MADFKVGDTVQLTSGGPVMTVAGQPTNTGKLPCQWFDDKAVREHLFQPEALKAAKP